MSSEKLWNTKEASYYLGVEIRTVVRYVKELGLPAIKIRRNWFYQKSKIDEWLERKSINIKSK